MGVKYLTRNIGTAIVSLVSVGQERVNFFSLIAQQRGQNCVQLAVKSEGIMELFSSGLALDFKLLGRKNSCGNSGRKFA